MTGSAKQIEWAERIIAEHRPMIVAAREALRETMVKAKAAGAAPERLAAGERAIVAIEDVIFEGDAGWWIENRDRLQVAIEARLPAADVARKMILPAFTMAKKRLAG